ncbi:MAG TPA: DUF305 domain-containing protein [Roseiflexaceae bacterium]|nr:DUF305 domain-containing protein [Roseiflexaceae bacterium]HMP42282.1 DUF305 domain-containing protein [Roseiflexaceae bacterium]
MTTVGSETTTVQRYWWLVLPVLPALLVGLVVGMFLPRFPTEGSAEVVFARDMAAHHSQAVEMAIIIRDRSADPDLRQFTLDIALTQQTQRGQFQGWLTQWGLPLSGAQPEMGGQGEQMGMATQAQIAQLLDLPPAEAEILFLQLMIRHHQGGVMMAQDILRTTRRTEVIRVADAVIAGQQSEIAYMLTLLERRGGTPPAPLEHMDHS